jgi:methionine--tRNA ligase beta chain
MITTNKFSGIRQDGFITFFTWELLLFLIATGGGFSRKGIPMISIDDFRKVELKIATVKAAEPHPNADRLMVLQVDLGDEQRQICAGIRGHYAPEDLIGKQIVIVANLETAKLRGMESQGMLLAASDEGRVIVLMPEKSVQAGAKVS